MSQTGTTATGTTPTWLAKKSHVTLPTIKPIGTPMMIPTRAKVVACELTVQTTWPFTNPSTFKSPVSRRRRETLTTNRWASVAAPKTATIAPNMSRKVDSLAKIDERGRSDGEHGYGLVRIEKVGDRRLPSRTGRPSGQDGAEARFLDRLSASLYTDSRGTYGGFITRESHHGAVSEAGKSVEHREWGGGDNSERDRALAT